MKCGECKAFRKIKSFGVSNGKKQDHVCRLIENIFRIIKCVHAETSCVFDEYIKQRDALNAEGKDEAEKG